VITFDPFDTPLDAAFPSSQREAYGALATASVQERLADDERQRTKALEAQVATLKANLENVTRDRDELQLIFDGYCENEPPIVKGALDAQADAERQWFAEKERAQTLARDLAHLRGLHEHTIGNMAAAHAELARVTSVLGEISKLVNVDVRGGDDDQVRRAVALLQARSIVLDEVLDGMLDGMSSQVRALLCDDQIEILDPRHPLALHLHVAGAVTFKDGWHWTAIGEALRQRRLERLGGRKRSGEYPAT